MILTFDPDADFEQYVVIPRGFCISLNGIDYLVCSVRREGVAVWPWLEQSAPVSEYPPEETARLYEWSEIESIHVY